MNKIKIALSILLSIATFGISEARNVIIFNNYPCKVHVRTWREFDVKGSLIGESERIVLNSGESTLIRDYREGCNSVYFHAPDHPSRRGMRKYKEFTFPEDLSAENIVVVLHPHEKRRIFFLGCPFRREIKVLPVTSLSEDLQGCLNSFNTVANIEQEVNRERDALYLLEGEGASQYIKRKNAWARSKRDIIYKCMQSLVQDDFISSLQCIFCDDITRLSDIQESKKASAISCSIFSEYRKKVGVVNGLLDEFLALLEKGCQTSVGEQRGLLVFNNHKYSVHVRQEYCGERSETIDLQPGQVMFIPNYARRSIHYHVPGETDWKNAFLNWGRIYKEYQFENDLSKSDSLVILRPSFARHSVEHDSQKAVLQVLRKKAQDACGLFFGDHIQRSANGVLHSLENCVVNQRPRVSMKRAIGFYGLSDIKKKISSHNLGEQEGELIQELQDSQQEGDFVIKRLIELGREIDIIRNILFVRFKNLNAIKSSFSELEGNILWIENITQKVKDSLGELACSENISSDRFVEEIRLLEEQYAESYSESVVKIIQPKKAFLSQFQEEFRKLSGELTMLKAKTSNLLRERFKEEEEEE